MPPKHSGATAWGLSLPRTRHAEAVAWGEVGDTLPPRTRQEWAVARGYGIPERQ